MAFIHFPLFNNGFFYILKKQIKILIKHQVFPVLYNKFHHS